MLSYPYLEDLFRSIFAQSAAIQGRFFMAPYQATELNASNLEQLVDASMGGNKQLKQYPLVLLMPPTSTADYGMQSIPDMYRLSFMFVKQQGVTSSGAVQGMSSRTGHTTHSTIQDWHDMKRCAVAFCKALKILVRDTTMGQYFLPSEKDPNQIQPITGMGNDKLAGVILRISGIIKTGCSLEDYPADFASHITIPTTDSHPQHSL